MVQEHCKYNFSLHKARPIRLESQNKLVLVFNLYRYEVIKLTAVSDLRLTSSANSVRKSLLALDDLDMATSTVVEDNTYPRGGGTDRTNERQNINSYSEGFTSNVRWHTDRRRRRCCYRAVRAPLITGVISAVCCRNIGGIGVRPAVVGGIAVGCRRPARENATRRTTDDGRPNCKLHTLPTATFESLYRSLADLYIY